MPFTFLENSRLHIRMVDIWNNVNENTIAYASFNGFKNWIAKFLYGRGFIYAVHLLCKADIHCEKSLCIITEKVLAAEYTEIVCNITESLFFKCVSLTDDTCENTDNSCVFYCQYFLCSRMAPVAFLKDRRH